METNNSEKKTKTPWPTKKSMEQIYEMNLWGGKKNEFYSGEGSHIFEIVNPYKEVIISFLKTFKTPLIVCDLGCGDFNVGKDLVAYAQKYTAIDIVEPLIEFNKIKYQHKNLEFDCLNIAVDNLPDGDCAILRQVLQHLSNQEIKSVLKKLQKYTYIILTEHIPLGDFIPNKDIISGQGIRIKKKSGVNILADPFYFKIKKEKVLTSFSLKNNKGLILTKLYTVL